MPEADRRAEIERRVKSERFAAWLGATVDVVGPGHGRASLTVTEDMLNFHGITQGGVVFALGDMAFGAASNSRGQTSVALNVTMSFLKATKPGDLLVAEAKELQASGPTALYDIDVRDARTGEAVARGQGLVYRKKEWFVPPEA